MFGMSSIEFWEDDPQLYWAYRFSYIKQKEFEQKQKIQEMQLNCWLQGKINNIAFEIALNNAFSKHAKQFPSFEKLFVEKNIEDTDRYKELSQQMEGVKDNDLKQQIEFNYWARLDMRKGG